MQFTVEFQVDHLERALEAVRQEIATPQQMLGSLGESLLQANKERHEKGLAPDGTPWKERSPMTKSRRARLLYDNGDMLGSFNYQVQGSALRLGFSDRKAIWHHGGTGTYAGGSPYTISPVKAKALHFGGMFRARVTHPGIPARPLVGFPASDRQLVTDVIEDHLTLVLNRVR
ncbi:MAG: phage virion morphogenesis protein [Methylobacillus sp.]|jgi:phage gpG-like protein|nr:phage virion morphogenesis protein [Methylobacillus sp.]